MVLLRLVFKQTESSQALNDDGRTTSITQKKKKKKYIQKKGPCNEGYFFMGWLIFKRCLFTSQFIWDRGGLYLANKDAGVGTQIDNHILILPDITLDLCSPRSIFSLKDFLCRPHLCGCLVVKVRSVYVWVRRLLRFTSAFPRFLCARATL